MTPRLPSCCRRSTFWLGAFVVWAVVLWTLSDGPLPAPPGPKIVGFDKILHFGYYFGGAVLLSAGLYFRAPDRPSWGKLTIAVVATLAVVGALDEWHQSWFPERSGNDLGDWIADTAGAFAGALAFRRLHRLFT